MHVLQEFRFSFPAWGSHFSSCFIWKQPGLEAALRFCAATAERKDDLSTQEARRGEFLSLCRKLDHLPDCFVEESSANCHLQSLIIATSVLQTPTLNFHCRQFRTGCDKSKFHPALRNCILRWQSSHCNVSQLPLPYYKDSFVLHFSIWQNVLYSTVLLENMLWSLTTFNTLLKCHMHQVLLAYSAIRVMAKSSWLERYSK